MHAASLALLALALTFLDAAAVGAAKRKPCGNTSWVVEDAPILPDDASLQHNGIVLRDGTLAVGGGCTAVKAKRKAGKKGTRLAARWKSCTGVTGPVRFKGTTDPACGTLTGTLRARKGGLDKAITAVAVPTGAVTGQVRVVRRVAVPVEARAGVLDYRAELEASGRSVAADGSTVDDPPAGAPGWLVRVGDRTGVTRADGTFALRLDPAPATEGELFHPGQPEDVAVVFFGVPHLAAAGATPTPVDVIITTQGPCGMDSDPAANPAYCASMPPVGTAAASVGPAASALGGGCGHAAGAHAAHVHDVPVTAAATYTWTTGALGSYPTLAGGRCADEDGGFGLSGESVLGVLTNYLFSTCHDQILSGCCDNELGSLIVSARTALGKITGWKPTPCDKNHKGRLCQELLQGDVAVQVPAGVASGQPNVRNVFGFPQSVTQPVTLGTPVPITVHHNGCYGDTIVEKTVDELQGGLSGPVVSVNGVTKVSHGVTGGAPASFTADVAITWVGGVCPPGVAKARDVYEFSTDGQVAELILEADCTIATTTTTTGTSGPTTTTIAGRAVKLLFATGGNAAASHLCLSRVTGGCVTPAHLPFCAYTHLHENTGAGIGIDGDGPYPDPEATMSEPCGYGEVVTVPGCGPDTIPPC